MAEEKKQQEQHKPHPHHDLPPHILNQLFEMKEKIGILEGKIEILMNCVKK